MPRPCKRRRVCGAPGCARFAPAGGEGKTGSVVTMTVDEYETIRLIDGEGLTQEACAAQMNVARTTVQYIYGSARKKLAKCLVEGRELVIEGGEYDLCSGQQGCRRACGRACGQNRRNGTNRANDRIAPNETIGTDKEV